MTSSTTLHNVDDIYYLMKLDSSGNFIWSTFGDVHLDSGFTDGRVVTKLSNGNQAISCTLRTKIKRC